MSAIGKPGPERTPSEVKKARGTFNTTRDGRRNEAPRVLGLPDEPAELSPGGQFAWRKFAPLLYNMGVIAKSDQTALLLLCETYAMLMTTKNEFYKLNGKTWYHEEIYDKEGNVKGTRLKEHPLVKTVRNLQKDLWAALAHFGLSPADASRAGFLGTPSGEGATSIQSAWDRLDN